jgi:hypothetical protein
VDEYNYREKKLWNFETPPAGIEWAINLINLA